MKGEDKITSINIINELGFILLIILLKNILIMKQ